MLTSKLIGKRIADARKKTGISQADLAQQLFISPQAVGKWERGESMPDLLTLNRLAELLTVDLNYFSNAEPGAQEPAMEVTTTTDKQEEPKKNLNWDLSRGNWIDADFSGLANLHEQFSSSNMKGCKFIHSNLSGLLLSGNNVSACDFRGSTIENSRIRNSNLEADLFNDCSLEEVQISGSNVEQCDFSGANLQGAVISRSHLSNCNFTGTDLTDALIKSGGMAGQKSKDVATNTLTNTVLNRTSFVDTQLADLTFTGTLEDCRFENCQFTRVVFREVTLINTFFKNNKRLKRIQFMDCKADRMTYEFLKQGKADVSGVELMGE